MSMEHWWNDPDMGKNKCSEKTHTQCQSVHHKSHVH